MRIQRRGGLGVSDPFRGGRSVRRRWLTGALVAGLTVGCGSAHGPVPERSDEPSGPIGVRIELEAAGDGSCCLVSTVNQGAALSVVCFVVVFDASDAYVATVLLPPKPPGHRRSSGFVAAAGTASHGRFEIPLDPATGSYRSTCRPAAWHGGAPI